MRRASPSNSSNSSLVLRGDLGADFGNAGIDVRGGLDFSGNGDADGPEECVRQFERRRLGDVEAVDEAVADQVEVAGDRRAGFAPEGTQAREHLCGVAVGREDLAGRGVLGERRPQAIHLVGATRGHHGRTAHQAQQLGRRQARPVPDVCEEVPGREHGTGGEVHVLGDHGRMVVAAARQIGDQLRVGEGIRIDGLQRPVRGDGGWFAILVPVAKLFPPELLREDLLGALKALRDLGVRSRQHLVVAEAVHVADLEAVDEHPVEAGEVVGAPLEGGGMRLLEVARHRAREVHGVLLPRSWPGRLETEFGRGVRRSHGGSSLWDGAQISRRRGRLSSRSERRARRPFRPARTV